MLQTMLIAETTTTTSTFYIYTVSQKKNIPDIFDCNVKKDYRILIIFGTNIPETTCRQVTFNFPSRSTSVSTLPGENRTTKILLFYSMRHACLINITRKNTFCSHF